MAGTRTVAVLVGNPALSSILSMTLAGAPSLKVRPFESELALSVYLRIAPIDLLVLDLDSKSVPPARVLADLRADSGLDARDFDVIALASAAIPGLSARRTGAGIDEVIVKPMSPRYLLERVEARLGARSRKAQQVPVRAVELPKLPSNVIPLWTRERPIPQH